MPQLNNLLISTFSAAKVVCNYAFAAKNGIRNSCRLLPAALMKFRLLLAFMKKTPHLNFCSGGYVAVRRG